MLFLFLFSFLLQKKRFHGENIGFHGVKDKYAQTSPTNGYGFPEMMNHESNLNFNEGVNGFGAKSARSAFYGGHPNLTNEVTLNLNLIFLRRDEQYVSITFIDRPSLVIR